MKRNILTTVALAILATAAASAQTVNLKATVPFSFVVGKLTLPAGEYSLQTIGIGQVLAMSNRDAKITNLVLPRPCVSRAADKSKLIFHRYGDRYFLSQIWTEGNSSGYEIPMSAREKETASVDKGQNVILLALKN